MATFERRGKLWRAKVRRKGYPSQSGTFPTKTEAQAWASSVEADMHRKRFIDTSEAEQTTLADALDRYVREISIHKKGFKQERNRAALIGRSRLGQYTLATIRGKDLAAYRDQRLKTMSPNSVNNELILLSHLFNIAIKEWGMEGVENPVAKIRRPSLPKGRERRISPHEEQAISGAMANEEMRVWLVLAIETGMRLSEFGGLDWSMIRDGIIYLEDTKNNQRRRIPLSSRAVAALAGLPRHISGQVFSIKPESIGKHFNAAAKRAGVADVRAHDCRHEATSRLFERGLNIMEVAAITGHKTLGMLQRYTHLKAEDLAKKLG